MTSLSPSSSATPSKKPIASCQGLAQLASRFDALICDVWGVIHNGQQSFRDALAALKNFRAQTGKCVVLVSNAPRLATQVEEVFTHLNIEASCYDALITSGEVARTVLKKRPLHDSFFYIGPEEDLPFTQGLALQRSSKEKANFILCSGLYDDHTQTPEDYQQLFDFLVARDIPMICTNPDIAVKSASRKFWCAGALAEKYQGMGGTVSIIGKPYGEIYTQTLATIHRLVKHKVAKNRILAIGDGLATDIAGGARHGMETLFIMEGLGIQSHGAFIPIKSTGQLEKLLPPHQVRPTMAMPKLVW